MAQQTVQVQAAPRFARLGTLVRAVRTGESIRPETAYGLAALVLALVLRHFWLDEGSLTNILFTTGVTAGLIAVLLLATRRVLFAVGVTAAIVTLIITTSAAKQRIMNMVAHAYDLVFYLSSTSTLTYLWSDQRRYVVAP